MPKLMGASASIIATTVSNFGFSAKRPDELTATEYTLAGLAIDVSPSTSPFLAQLEKAVATVHGALTKSPRAENLLLRVVTFDENLNEVHGFVNLADVKASDYSLACNGGGTALNDATLAGVEAIESEGSRLFGLDYGVNGILVVITDGEENSSGTCRRGNEQKIKDAIERTRRAEKLESFKTILVGVGSPDATNPDDPDNRVKAVLEDFAKAAGFDQFIWIGKATAQNIAKLGGFVSKSVSASSQALGTGGASQNLTF